MAITFYDVNSTSGLKKLDAHLLTCSYITGYQASKDDITVHAALSKPPPTEFVNVSRWYNHIEALLRISGVSGEGSGVVVVGSAPITEEAIATPPAGDSKAAAADDDDDDDVDLFGEETEERAASIKASSKKKEFDRENEWITNELNTPLTPRSSSTAILDPAQDKNHDFNSRMSGIESATPYSSLWLAPNPSKRWGELFFLGYTPFWLTLCLGIIVPYKLYEDFAELEYLIVGLVSAVPSFLIPMLFSGKADSMLPWKERYWVKASLWIIIFSYVGNYFWTHYFFTVLGASYTFPSWRMNNVPHTTFLLTHTCFLFYHVSSNLTLRRLRHFIADKPDKVQWLVEAAWILALSYFIAYLETIAISNFPYYDFVDRASMYTVGSLFYAIYFLVSFPMFIRIDEKPGAPWDLPRVAVDALGAAMLVTIILDLWRIFLGPIVPIPNTNKQCIQPGLPWFPGHDTSA